MAPRLRLSVKKKSSPLPVALLALLDGVGLHLRVWQPSWPWKGRGSWHEAREHRHRAGLGPREKRGTVPLALLSAATKRARNSYLATRAEQLSSFRYRYRDLSRTRCNQRLQAAATLQMNGDDVAPQRSFSTRRRNTLRTFASPHGDPNHVSRGDKVLRIRPVGASSRSLHL